MDQRPIPSSFKLAIVGSSCSGKSTLARRLSRKLELKHIELDGLFWEEGWFEASLVVWLDLPLRVILARFVRRSSRRLLFRERLWSGNRERIRNNFLGRQSLLAWILKNRSTRG